MPDSASKEEDFAAISSADLALSAQSKGQSVNVPDESPLFVVPDYLPQSEEPKAAIQKIEGYLSRIEQVLEQIESTKAKLLVIGHRAKNDLANLSSDECLDNKQMEAHEAEHTAQALERTRTWERLDDQRALMMNMADQLNALMVQAKSRMA